MKYILSIAALALTLAAPAFGQQTLSVPPIPVTGVVCDSQAFAEHLVDLSNSGVSNYELWRRVSLGQKEPVCGVVRIAMYPEQVVSTKLLHGQTLVDIMRVNIVWEQLPGGEMGLLPPGVVRYLILVRKDIST